MNENIQIMLGVKHIDKCENLLCNSFVSKLITEKYIRDNYPLSTPFDSFIYQINNNLKGSLSGSDTYKDLSITVKDKMISIYGEYVNILDTLEEYTTSIFERDFIASLLVTYKILALLNMKNKLKDISKEDIVNIRTYCTYIINYLVEYNEEKTQDILKQLDVAINNYLCYL